MSLSVIIPAFNEHEWLNRTIKNIRDTSTGIIEIIVVLNGYDQDVEEADHVVRLDANMGERVAMNEGMKRAIGSHMLRIDAHCDFSPDGWDQVMVGCTGEKDMTQAVLTATDKQWERIPGHYYERCRLLPTMEAKWEKPNITDGVSPILVPNMSSTGCGFCMMKDWYWYIGGADESLPAMGAIGEEFSVKTWLNGGKVQTCTSVMIGHIFDTGGYDTGGVIKSRKALVSMYGDRYNEIRDKFPDIEIEGEDVIKMKPTSVDSNTSHDDIVVTSTKEEVRRDKEGNDVYKLVKTYRYIWLPELHPEELVLSRDEIASKYQDKGVCVDTRVQVLSEDGEWIDQIDSPD